MKNMKPLLFIALLFGNFTAFSQIGGKDLLCGKKWYPSKMQESDGTVEVLPKDYHTAYTFYKCNGTFESIEVDPKRMTINGSWSYNSTTNEILGTQTQNKMFPQKMAVKLVKLTASEMAIETKDGGGDKIRIYFTHKL